jgi:hypothetical protein
MPRTRGIRRRSETLAIGPGEDYRGSVDEPEVPEPKKRPLRSSGGAGQTIGGILAGFDYQVFRASKPTAELVQAAKPVRGLSGEDGDLVGVDFPLEPPPPEGGIVPPGRTRRKPPTL